MQIFQNSVVLDTSCQKSEMDSRIKNILHHIRISKVVISNFVEIIIMCYDCKLMKYIHVIEIFFHKLIIQKFYLSYLSTLHLLRVFVNNSYEQNVKNFKA